jgi:hypothetical protein
MEIEEGIPMSDTGAMPSDAEIDNLLSGGTPNQERIPMESEKPLETPDHDKVIDPSETAPESNEAGAPPVDPIVSRVQQALASLTPEQRAAVMSQPIEIVHNGQKLAIAPDKQVPLMQMGMNYSERMRALNVERQEFEKQKESGTQMERYYGEIDRVAKENPEWWSHVTSSFQQYKLSGGAGNADGIHGDTEMTPALRASLSKITELEQKLDGFLSEKTKEADMKRIQSEDAELEQHIQGFQKEYPDLDWITADGSGLVLADRITIHAEKNGINNFRAAARDYLFNDIVSRNELKSKEALKQNIQSKTKAGVVTSKRPNGLSTPKNLNRGYEDLMMEGLKELG